VDRRRNLEERKRKLKGEEESLVLSPSVGERTTEDAEIRKKKMEEIELRVMSLLLFINKI
jgi:hypothetical protein